MGMALRTASGDTIRDRWKWFVGFGVAIAIFGVITLLNVVDATLVTTVFVGFLLILGGITQIIAAFAQAGSTGARLLQAALGILYVVVGFNIVADPLAGALALTLVIGIMLMVDGAIRLGSVIGERPPHATLLAIVAVVNILLGLWIVTGIPATGVAIGLFVGLQLLMAGIAWIALGWMAKSVPDRTDAVPA
jgi:uncharacterized membrane protein HdeD (DUF308 family)